MFFHPSVHLAIVRQRHRDLLAAGESHRIAEAALAARRKGHGRSLIEPPDPRKPVANDGRLSPDPGGCMSAPARELAQRLSGMDEVLLLWRPESERVELSVRDVETGQGFHFEVAPGSAIDAFYHPYAYVAWRENSDHVVRAETTSVDG